MNIYPHRPWTRREFCRGLSATGAAGLLHLYPGPVAAEPEAETTTIRLSKVPALCFAPQYLAEDLLRLEGFSDIQYLDGKLYDRLASGGIDITQSFIAPFLQQVDDGLPTVLIGGVHVGCFQLIAIGDIRTISDLRGKTLAVPPGSLGPRLWIAAILSYVGLKPEDVNYVEYPKSETARLLVEGEIDAYLGFPPIPQELQAKGIGHVVLNSSTDLPWSQYYCCVAAGNKEFVQRNPVATKKALRALMKADRLCALQPERVAQYLVDRNFTDNYDCAIATLRDVGYGLSTKYNLEDAVRFYALRLYDVGIVRNTPEFILSKGTDLKIFKELQRELKS